MPKYFITHFTSFSFISIFRKRKRRTHASSSSNQAGPTQAAHSPALALGSASSPLARARALTPLYFSSLADRAAPLVSQR
jgi:hypothetical protein